MGRGNPYVIDTLYQLIKENKLEDRVEILGHQPFSKVISYINASKICLVPHHSNPHTDNTVPHKLFQYMVIGRPLLVSSSPPLKRIVEDCQSGKVFEAGNPQDFANQVDWMVENPEFCKTASQNGKVMTSLGGKYSFEKDMLVLREIYK